MSLFRPNRPRQEVQTLRAFAAFILAFALVALHYIARHN